MHSNIRKASPLRTELSIEIQLIIKKGSSCVFTATYMCDGIDYCKILHAEQDVAYFLRHLSL